MVANYSGHSILSHSTGSFLDAEKDEKSFRVVECAGDGIGFLHDPNLGFITPASATMYWAYAIWELNGPGPDLHSKGQLGTLEVGQAPGHYLVGSIAAVYLTGLCKSPHLFIARS